MSWNDLSFVSEKTPSARGEVKANRLILPCNIIMFGPRLKWQGTPLRSNTVKLDCSQEHIDFGGMFSIRRRDTRLMPSAEIRLWSVARKG